MAKQTDQEAASEWASTLLQNELKDFAERHPDRIEVYTDEVKAERHAKFLRYGLDMIESLNDKATAFTKLRNGAFHPSNKNTRKAFEHVTGIKLPSTVLRTHETIEKWIGTEYCDSIRATEKREREERIAAAKAKKAEEWIQHIAEISRKALADEDITGCDLLDLCRSLEVEVHLRTQGAMLKKIVSISGKGARVRGKYDTTLVWRAFRTCVVVLIALTKPEEEESVDPEVEKLFAGTRS